MKKEALKRPDQLLVITQGTRGGKQHSNLQGQIKAVVKKGYNEPENSITIDVFTGTAENYKPAETALINISFSDQTEWNGNFEQLRHGLKNYFHPNKAATTLKFIKEDGFINVMINTVIAFTFPNTVKMFIHPMDDSLNIMNGDTCVASFETGNDNINFEFEGFEDLY